MEPEVLRREGFVEKCVLSLDRIVGVIGGESDDEPRWVK